jgi:hypothetical protein
VRVSEEDFSGFSLAGFGGFTGEKTGQRRNALDPLMREIEEDFSGLAECFPARKLEPRLNGPAWIFQRYRSVKSRGTRPKRLQNLLAVYLAGVLAVLHLVKWMSPEPLGGAERRCRGGTEYGAGAGATPSKGPFSGHFALPLRSVTRVTPAPCSLANLI